MVLGIVGVKVIVVIGQCYKIPGTGFFVELHQSLGVPLFSFPKIVKLHKAELRGVPIMFDMIVVLAPSLDVHVPRIPIALLRHALRRPVRPDSELGIPEPLGRLIIGNE